jgi:hypothetical protein
LADFQEGLVYEFVSGTTYGPWRPADHSCLFIMFDPGHTLAERILSEQFGY